MVDENRYGWRNGNKDLLKDKVLYGNKEKFPDLYYGKRNYKSGDKDTCEV